MNQENQNVVSTVLQVSESIMVKCENTSFPLYVLRCYLTRDVIYSLYENKQVFILDHFKVKGFLFMYLER